MSDCRFGVSPVNYPDPKLSWSLKNTTKALLKGSKNLKKQCETRGQKLSQLYHLQFDAAKTYQSRALEVPDYRE